jgi:hypothetical protein
LSNSFPSACSQGWGVKSIVCNKPGHQANTKKAALYFSSSCPHSRICCCIINLNCLIGSKFCIT